MIDNFDSSTFDFDLNIVAVPTSTTKCKPQAKKKHNKYEKRRQKAQKSRQKQQQTPETPSKGVSVASNEQSSSDAKDDRSLQRKQPRQDQQQQQTASERKSFSSKVPQDKPRTRPIEKVGETKELSTKKREHDADSSVKGTSLSTTILPQLENETTLKLDIDSSVVPSKRKSKHSSRSLDDEEERAKYLAEFHARPMELDRRSGARFSIIQLSKESTHLFDHDDEDIPNDWNQLRIHPRLVQTVQSDSFGKLQRPTTIQSRTIHAFQKFQHNNILIHSETGSGKTLAYILPILQSLAFGEPYHHGQAKEGPCRLQKIPRSQLGCKCIILCPTRELASQTLQTVERLCQANFAGWIVPGGLLGGDSRNSEKARLRKGLAIVVASPGRLLDHLHKTQSLALSLKGQKFQWLVLDEADRLLDMGLGDQVRQIVQWIRANEATKEQREPWWRSVLVSATVTPSVQALATERMLSGKQQWIWVNGGRRKKNVESNSKKDCKGAENNMAVKDSAGNDNFADSTPRQLAQFHITVTAKLRLSALIAFLVQRIAKGHRTVVFIGTCASVDYHYELFQAPLETSLWGAEVNDDADTKLDESAKSSLGLFGRKAQVYKLHGNVPHSKRVQTMKDFSKSTTTGSSPHKSSGAAILLTTDVSARGLNLDSIDWTVQYDPPCEIADYVHRVGRGARAGEAGHSLLFLLPSERKYLEVLETKGISNLIPLSLSSLLNDAASECPEWTKAGVKQSGGDGGGSSKKLDTSSSGRKNSRRGEFFSKEVQRQLEEFVVQDDIRVRAAWKEKEQLQRKQKTGKKYNDSKVPVQKEGTLLALARDAYLSFLRAYPTKKEPIVRSIFSSRALHLGHVAKSFALKEPPTTVVSNNKRKKQQQQEEAQDTQDNLPKSLEFGDAPGHMEDNAIEDEKHSNGFKNDFFDKDNNDGEDDGEDYPSKTKRQKFQKEGKIMNAKSLLLANAMKMQNNLMDAM